MVIPHASKRGHELDPPRVVDLGFGWIGGTISPKQHAQMIPVHRIHPRGEDETEAAIVRLRVGEPGSASHPAHRAAHDAPRGWVCLPAIEIDAIQYSRAARVGRFRAL